MNKRARAKGHPIMTREDLDAIFARAKGKCEVTGIPFTFKRLKGKVKRPWAPSIDRIDNSLGYEATNCRLVCVSVNLAMNEFGMDVLLRIVTALSKGSTIHITRLLRLI